MNNSPKTLLMEVIDDKDAIAITSELLNRWHEEGNHQKLITYHAACLRSLSAPTAEKMDVYVSANEWCFSELGVDLSSVWQDSKKEIMTALPCKFRAGGLWVVVKPICRDLGIPSDICESQRIGRTSNKATLRSALVSSLADFGLRKGVQWWTRQKFDGVSYLVKTTAQGDNLLDFPAAN